MKEKGQIKSGAIITYISTACNNIIAILITPIILSLVGKAEYGLYSLVYSMMAYFSVLDFGFGNAMIRYISKCKAEKKDDKNINSLFLIFYFVIAIITILLGIIAYFNLDVIFGSSLSEVELNKASIMLIICILGTAISFPLSIFNSYVLANEKFVFLKVVNLLRILFYPIIIIPLLLLGFKSIAMIGVYTLLNLLSHISYAIYAIKKLKMQLTFKIKNIDFSIFKEIISYSFFIFLNIIVDTVFNNTDQVILGAVSGTVAVSIYAVANQIKTANSSFSTAISGLFLPKITKLITLNKKEEVNEIFIKVSKIQLYIMLLILSGFFIFGKSFIMLWVGEDYIDSYYIALLLIGFSIVPLTQNIGVSILQAMNKHKFRSVMYILIAVLNVVVSIPLARVYGGIGAAAGSALANVLGQYITMNIYYYKVAKLDIPLYWKNFIKISLPVIIISVLITLKLNTLSLNWISFTMLVFVYTGIYAIYIFLFHMDKEEKNMLKILKMRSKRRKKNE